MFWLLCWNKSNLSWSYYSNCVVKGTNIASFPFQTLMNVKLSNITANSFVQIPLGVSHVNVHQVSRSIIQLVLVRPTETMNLHSYRKKESKTLFEHFLLYILKTIFCYILMHLALLYYSCGLQEKICMIRIKKKY